MMEMIDKKIMEAKYLAKTDSTEYWDEMPQPDKIQSMTEYLRDVCLRIPPVAIDEKLIEHS